MEVEKSTEVLAKEAKEYVEKECAEEYKTYLTGNPLFRCDAPHRAEPWYLWFCLLSKCSSINYHHGSENPSPYSIQVCIAANIKADEIDKQMRADSRMTEYYQKKVLNRVIAARECEWGMKEVRLHKRRANKDTE